MDLNEAFHAAIIDLAKSAMLKRALPARVSLPFASPSAMVFPTSGLAYADEALAIAKEHHRSLIEAIANDRAHAPKTSPASTPSSAGASWPWRSLTPRPAARSRAPR